MRTTSSDDSADELLASNMDIKFQVEKTDEEKFTLKLKNVNALLEHPVVTKVEENEEEEDEEAVDEPSQLQIKISNVSSLQQQTAARGAEEEEGGFHTCILGASWPLPDHIAKKDRCTGKNPVRMPLKEMPFHYYLHYKDRGAWDDVVRPLATEEKDRVESYECMICKNQPGSTTGPKFRVKLGEDPEPQRCSFIYHFAHHHGKLVDAMRADKEMDMTHILDLFHTHIPSYRSFVKNGTKTEFDSKPAYVNNRTEWTVRHKQLFDVAKQGLSSSTGSHRNNTPTVFSPCPKMNKPSCKDTVRNKSKSDMKLHLTTEHYLDYWKNSVPEMKSLEARCVDCRTFKAQGATLEGCRTSMVCHRAMAHDELRDALEEDDEISEDFVSDLYSDKPKALTKDDLTSTGQTAAAAARVADLLKQEEKKKNEARAFLEQMKKKSGRPGRRKVVEPEDELDVEAGVPALPYVRKRIRQNLSYIDFQEDSDEDWDVGKKQKTPLVVARKSLPPRSRRGVSQRYRDDSSSPDPDDLEDADSD